MAMAGGPAFSIFGKVSVDTQKASADLRSFEKVIQQLGNSWNRVAQQLQKAVKVSVDAGNLAAAAAAGTAGAGAGAAASGAGLRAQKQAVAAVVTEEQKRLAIIKEENKQLQAQAQLVKEIAKNQKLKEQQRAGGLAVGDQWKAEATRRSAQMQELREQKRSQGGLATGDQWKAEATRRSARLAEVAEARQSTLQDKRARIDAQRENLRNRAQEAYDARRARIEELKEQRKAAVQERFDTRREKIDARREELRQQVQERFDQRRARIDQLKEERQRAVQDRYDTRRSRIEARKEELRQSAQTRFEERREKIEGLKQQRAENVQRRYEEQQRAPAEAAALRQRAIDQSRRWQYGTEKMPAFLSTKGMEAKDKQIDKELGQLEKILKDRKASEDRSRREAEKAQQTADRETARQNKEAAKVAREQAAEARRVQKDQQVAQKKADSERRRADAEIEKQYRDAERDTARLMKKQQAATAGAQTGQPQGLMERLAPVGFAAQYLGVMDQLTNAFKGMIGASQELETLRVRLNGVSSSMGEAAKIYDYLLEKARTSPFEFQDIAKAGVLFKALKLNVEQSISTVEKLAATFAPDQEGFQAAMQGVAKASSGAAEGVEILRNRFGLSLPVLRQYGVTLDSTGGVILRSKSDIDKFRAAIEQHANSVSKNGQTVIDLQGSLQTKFSNLQDVIFQTAAAFGDRLSPYIKGALDIGIAFLDFLKELPAPLKDLTLIILSLTTAMIGLSRAAATLEVLKGMGLLLNTLRGGGAAAAAGSAAGAVLPSLSQRFKPGVASDVAATTAEVGLLEKAFNKAYQAGKWFFATPAGAGGVLLTLVGAAIAGFTMLAAEQAKTAGKNRDFAKSLADTTNAGVTATEQLNKSVGTLDAENVAPKDLVAAQEAYVQQINDTQARILELEKEYAQQREQVTDTMYGSQRDSMLANLHIEYSARIKANKDALDSFRILADRAKEKVKELFEYRKQIVEQQAQRDQRMQLADASESLGYGQAAEELRMQNYQSALKSLLALTKGANYGADKYDSFAQSPDNIKKLIADAQAQNVNPQVINEMVKYIDLAAKTTDKYTQAAKSAADVQRNWTQAMRDHALAMRDAAQVSTTADQLGNIADTRNLLKERLAMATTDQERLTINNQINQLAEKELSIRTQAAQKQRDTEMQILRWRQGQYAAESAQITRDMKDLRRSLPDPAADFKRQMEDLDRTYMPRIKQAKERLASGSDVAPTIVLPGGKNPKTGMIEKGVTIQLDSEKQAAQKALDQLIPEYNAKRLAAETAYQKTRVGVANTADQLEMQQREEALRQFHARAAEMEREAQAQRLETARTLNDTNLKTIEYRRAHGESRGMQEEWKKAIDTGTMLRNKEIDEEVKSRRAAIQDRMAQDAEYVQTGKQQLKDLLQWEKAQRKAATRDNTLAKRADAEEQYKKEKANQIASMDLDKQGYELRDAALRKQIDMGHTFYRQEVIENLKQQQALERQILDAQFEQSLALADDVDKERLKNQYRTDAIRLLQQQQAVMTQVTAEMDKQVKKSDSMISREEDFQKNKGKFGTTGNVFNTLEEAMQSGIGSEDYGKFRERVKTDEDKKKNKAKYFRDLGKFDTPQLRKWLKDYNAKGLGPPLTIEDVFNNTAAYGKAQQAGETYVGPAAPEPPMSGAIRPPEEYNGSGPAGLKPEEKAIPVRVSGAVDVSILINYPGGQQKTQTQAPLSPPGSDYPTNPDVRPGRPPR